MASANFGGDGGVLEPEHALLLLLTELRKRPHRFGEGFLEAERTVLRVLACHDDFGPEGEIVAYEHSRARTK